MDRILGFHVPSLERVTIVCIGIIDFPLDLVPPMGCGIVGMALDMCEGLVTRVVGPSEGTNVGTNEVGRCVFLNTLYGMSVSKDN